MSRVPIGGADSYIHILYLQSANMFTYSLVLLYGIPIGGLNIDAAASQVYFLQRAIRIWPQPAEKVTAARLWGLPLAKTPTDW